MSIFQFIMMAKILSIRLLLSTVLILVVLLVDNTMSEQGHTQQGCPLGQFCRLGANCSDYVSECVESCPSDTERMIQGNWSTGNCERSKLDYAM